MTTASSSRPYWTIRATGERLGMSTSSVHKLARTGFLVKMRLPGFERRVVVTAESIDAYEALIEAQARRLALVEGAIA